MSQQPATRHGANSKGDNHLEDENIVYTCMFEGLFEKKRFFFIFSEGMDIHDKQRIRNKIGTTWEP